MQFTAVWVPSFLLRSRLISKGAGLQVLLPSRSAHSHRDKAFRNYLTNDTVPRLGMSKVTYCSVSPESLEPNLYLFIKKKTKQVSFSSASYYFRRWAMDCILSFEQGVRR